jgi:hypothetical protein
MSTRLRLATNGHLSSRKRASSWIDLVSPSARHEKTEGRISPPRFNIRPGAERSPVHPRSSTNRKVGSLLDLFQSRLPGRSDSPPCSRYADLPNQGIIVHAENYRAMFPMRFPIAFYRTQQRSCSRSSHRLGMVPPPRLERGTPRSTIWCSNQLSYGGPEAAGT